MTQSKIIDNWSLQEITNIFINGLTPVQTSEISISNGQHSYSSISSAVIQTEALFDFLTNLVLCDEILVDSDFTSVWDESKSPIFTASEKGILVSHPFLKKPEKIDELRERILEHICSTQSLIEAHKKNVVSWEKTRQTPDNILAAILWGGAGMCARSFVFEKSYTPHPLRRRFFINSGFMSPEEDAFHKIETFINDQKVKIIRKIHGEDSLSSASVNIPPIPLRVIQESDSLDLMISTAIQMRDDFREFRAWLNSLQEAMSSGDIRKLLKNRKELDSVSLYIDNKIGYGSTKNPVSMQAGIGIFKMSFQGNPIEHLKNQFGVRTTLNKLIFSPTGKAEIRKYAKMLGENNTEIGLLLENKFT